MILASDSELLALQNLIQEYLSSFGKNVGQVVWGYQGGNTPTEATYIFAMPAGVLYVGAAVEDSKLWVPIGLEDELSSEMLNIRFEFNVPNKPSNQPSLRFAKRSKNVIEILHNGRVTVGSSVPMSVFFKYYLENPWHWTVIEESDQKFLRLCSIDFNRNDYAQWYEILSTLTKFADFITWFKDWFRETHDK